MTTFIHIVMGCVLGVVFTVIVVRVLFVRAVMKGLNW